MLWRGEISGEKSRFHPSSFALAFAFGFEGFFFAAVGLSVADGGELV